MTNQQGAPEAPPPAFVHYPPKKPELARVDFLPIATKAERSNGWVTVALVEAQQPAPSAAPAEWLEHAFREGWSACRDAEFVGEEAEDWAFGNSQANSRMIDIQQAAPQPSPTPQADSVLESEAMATAQAAESVPAVDAMRAALLRCIAAIERTAHCTEADRLAAADEARAAIAADRAARAPADSVTAPATEGYVQPVPDKCDRIVWRGRYYHLPLIPPAQVADSVEHATRYRWLRDCNLAKFPEINTAFYLGNKNLDAAIDAAMKAGGAR